MDSCILKARSSDFSATEVERSSHVSDGGTGLTTVQMQNLSTFLAAGWDFAGETANGENDTWWIIEGQDYPRLWWELDESQM